MFNDYSVFQMMKLRQEEIERNARDAWERYIHLSEMNDVKETSLLSKRSVDPCCKCACA